MTEPERKETAHLREQLAQMRRECDRSAAMTNELIAAFGAAFRRGQRKRNDDSAVFAQVSLDGGAATMPLGIKDQAVRIDSSGTEQRVTATALCGDSSHVVVLRLRVELDQLRGLRDVAGEPVDVANRAHGTFLVRLLAGETRELFRLEAGAEKTDISLCRVGGEPCALRLEVGEAAAAAGNPSLASMSAGDRASGKGTLWKAQELLREGCPDRAMEVALAYATEVERPALALLRATLARDDADWLANVNAYLEQFEIVPVRLEGTSAPRFLRLAADPPRPVSGGPLVTVIMPAFNAERTLAFAADSILKQSWAQIELIIVDDCSADGTWEAAQRIARLDRRVRVFRNRVNVGPYVSKNLALSAAQGAYITCHDADDWAHPQRIERQVQAMKSAGARASVASFLRLDEAGAFGGFTSIGRQSHDGALRVAHVTCMIETEFMRRYVGHWDCVRFGADGEMLERLEHVLRNEVLRVRQLAVLSLDSPQSLTNDAAHGISKRAGLSETRRAYRDAWRQWHSTLTFDSAFIAFPQHTRPFAAPKECVVPSAAMNLVCPNNSHAARSSAASL